MPQVDAKTLLEKYKTGQCTPEEIERVEDYIINVGITPQDPSGMESYLEELRSKTVGPHIKTRKMIRPLRIAIAAAVIIILSLVGTLFLAPDNDSPVSLANVVHPGSDQAILTLANGTQINLSEAKSGPLLESEEIVITKAEDGTLVYKITGSKSNVSGYNTITTPRGGQYKIILSDGTRVWLNAASSLSYRAAVNYGGALRSVKMSGEAYFEVAKVMIKDKGARNKESRMPFIVITDQQELEVLGTHFNVSAYPDEYFTKTTLLEGSVRISRLASGGRTGADTGINSIILKPNQQSTLTQNNIQISKVDTEEAVSWKNGEFIFQNKPLESIMLEISRWYNVDVVYEDKQIAQKLFGGMISRSEELSRVLSALEVTGDVHFKVEGRKVTAMK